MSESDLPKREKCEHDFANAIRQRRATYICPKCNRDISLEYFFWFEATKK